MATSFFVARTQSEVGEVGEVGEAEDAARFRYLWEKTRTFPEDMTLDEVRESIDRERTEVTVSKMEKAADQEDKS